MAIISVFRGRRIPRSLRTSYLLYNTRKDKKKKKKKRIFFAVFFLDFPLASSIMIRATLIPSLSPAIQDTYDITSCHSFLKVSASLGQCSSSVSQQFYRFTVLGGSSTVHVMLWVLEALVHSTGVLRSAGED